MRTKLVLAAALLGAAGAVLPVAPAAAVCSRAWEFATGDCSPCSTAGKAYRAVTDVTGDPLGDYGHIVSCAA